MSNLSVNQKRIISFVLAFFVTLVIGFSIIGISVNAESTGEYVERNGVLYRVVNDLNEVKKAEPIYYDGSYYDCVINVIYQKFIGYDENGNTTFRYISGLMLYRDVDYIKVEEDIVLTEFNNHEQVYCIKVYYKDDIGHPPIINANVYSYDGNYEDTMRSKNFSFGFSTVDIYNENDENIRPFDVHQDLNVTYSEDDENYIFTIETTQEAEYYCYIMAYEIEADNITHGRKIFDYESFVTKRSKEHYVTLGIKDIIKVLNKQEYPEAFDTTYYTLDDWRYKFLKALVDKMRLYDSNFPDIDSYYFTLKEDLSWQEFEYGCRSFIETYNNWYLFHRPKSVKDKFNKLHMFTVYNSSHEFFNIKIPFNTKEQNFHSAMGILKGNQVISIPKTWYNTVYGKPYDHTVLICNRNLIECKKEDIKYFNFRFIGLGYDGSDNPANDPNYKNTILDGDGNPTDYVIQDHIQASADDKAEVNDKDLFGDGSFTGITNGVFDWIKGFIYIFPKEVQTIITLSLVIILAIGLIRLVVG